MNSLRTLIAALAVGFVFPATAAAEETDSDGSEAGELSVTVEVTHGARDGEPQTEKGVLLRATRPQGPFERRAPEPAHEWTAVTDDRGRAVFEEVPESIVEEGLRLSAATTHGGHTFETHQATPHDGLSLDLKVFETGRDPSGVVVEDVQTIVHVWEDHLFVQQRWQLGNDGDRVIETSMLDGEAYEDGLPIELPLKAQGIEVQGAGESEVIDSTVHWKGTLKPGQTVPITAHFSLSVPSTRFVYEQPLDYPTDRFRVTVPFEPQHERLQVRYFEGLELAAPDFEVGIEEASGPARNQGRVLAAERTDIPPGGSVAFELSGLPFERPKGAWITIALGLLGALFVVGYARRERERIDKSRNSGELAEILREEREELLDELAYLEQDYLDNRVSELEYERERLLLRERIALVMKKLRDLEGEPAA